MLKLLHKRGKEFMVVLFALSIGFLLFEPWLVLLQMLLGVTVWSVIRAGKSVNREAPDEPKSQEWLMWLLLGLFMLTRLYPFWWAEHPLGYDTGIYLFEVWRSVSALPEYVSSLFLGFPLVADVASVFGLSVQSIVYGSLLAAALSGFVMFAFYVRSLFGWRAAALGAFLFWVSLVQWQAFEMVLLKQILALGLVFFCFFLVEKRSFWFLPVVIFLALLQPLDAFLVGVSVVLYMLWSWKSSLEKRPYFVWLLLWASLLSLLVMLVDPGFWYAAWDVFSNGLLQLDQVEASLQRGVFLSLDTYGYQAAIIFVLGILGWVQERYAGSHSVLSAYFVVLLLWIVLDMFFSQRLLIQFDAVLIIYASFSLLTFMRPLLVNWQGKLMVAVILLGLSLPFGYRLAQFQPSFSAQEYESMLAFCAELEADHIVVATDSSNAPWLRAACKEHHLFGPGLFANQWSRQDWEAFWEGDVARVAALLGQYDKDMYFYVGEEQKTPAFAEALFEQVNEHWWRNR